MRRRRAVAEPDGQGRLDALERAALAGNVQAGAELHRLDVGRSCRTILALAARKGDERRAALLHETLTRGDHRSSAATANRP